MRIISTDVLDRTSKEVDSKPTTDASAPEEEDSLEGSGEGDEETVDMTPEEKRALVTGQLPVLASDNSTEVDDSSEVFSHSLTIASSPHILQLLEVAETSSEETTDKNTTSTETSQKETATTTEALVTTTTQRTTTPDEAKRQELIEKAVREVRGIQKSLPFSVLKVISEARDKNLAPNPVDIARAMRGQFDGAPCTCRDFCKYSQMNTLQAAPSTPIRRVVVSRCVCVVTTVECHRS